MSDEVESDKPGTKPDNDTYVHALVDVCMELRQVLSVAGVCNSQYRGNPVILLESDEFRRLNRLLHEAKAVSQRMLGPAQRRIMIGDIAFVEQPGPQESASMMSELLYRVIHGPR